ncbi:ATP-binding protein [Actinocorallia libanotica]|uniref:histidine kinase n=1 Tax=Actinocorallia libanotica TaxID=46162 RepID=A0ABP4B7S1_9ACTN
MEHLSLLAFVCASIAFFAVSLLLMRQRRLTARLEEESALLAAGVNARDQALRHLVTIGLPQMAASPGHPAAAPHRGLLQQTDFARDLDAVTALFASSAEGIRAHADKAAKSMLRTMMRTVQSLAGEQQVVITEMQLRHDDPAVLEDLLRIDHMNAQLGRRVQATAVLCGSWPGLQRQASSVEDVVRGATSRIRDYLRIKIYAEPNVAVVSRAVEPVVLAVAELLDNAARHSQPSTPVEVNFQTTHNGLAVMIDDAGVAMDAEEVQQASALLDGRQSVDIHRLGDPPQIGFAAIGVLAARYGFRVSVDSRSPYGGVRAVVFLPSELLTAVTRQEPARFETVPPAPAVTSGGLPKRRRQEGEAAPDPAVSLSAPAAPVRPEPSRRKAAGLGAWQRGTRSGRAVFPSASEEKDQP